MFSSAARLKVIAAPAGAKRLQSKLSLSIDRTIRIGSFANVTGLPKHLLSGNLALAQIYALSIPVIELDAKQLQNLATIARLVKANFNPDQTRDARGRWTHGADTEARLPSGAPRETRPEPADTVLTPARGDTVPVQLAADNQRENKMVRDIVVQLKLTKDQQQRLHRYISGQGYSYHEVLEIADK